MMVQNLAKTIAYRYHGIGRVMRFFITPKMEEGTRKIAILAEDVAGNRSVAITIEKVLDYFPNAPTSFVAVYNAGPKTVTLTWVDPTNSDLDSIRVFQGKGTGVVSPDYEIEIGSVAAGVLTFTTGALTDDDYIFGIRALDTPGNLESNVDVLVRVNVPNAAIPTKIGFESEIIDEGEDETVLVGVPLTDGKVKLEWEYFEDKANATVTQFKVYTDNGTGVVDFSTAIGTVTRNSDTSITLHTFTSGTITTSAQIDFKFVVRAETAAAVDDRNTDFITVTLYGQPPMQIADVVGSVVRALNSEDGIS